MSLVFCDSFAHYDTAGIALKYSVAGGAIETNPAHIRTGPQALRIQASDAPSLLNWSFPPDVTQTYSSTVAIPSFVVGMAYQAGALNGNVFEVWRSLSLSPSPAERQLFVRLNADGSVSLLAGASTVLGTSAAGIITAGAFFYYTLSANLNLAFGPIFATLNITTSAFVSTDVISVTGFSTSQTFMDSIIFGGPAGPAHGWVNDFYVLDTRDGSKAAVAPNIFATLPNADGPPDVNIQSPWQPIGSPHFSLVNTVPEQEVTGIEFLHLSPFGAPAESYKYDCTALPDGRKIKAIQSAFLWHYGADSPFPAPETFTCGGFLQDAADPSNPSQPQPIGGAQATQNMPFMYLLVPSDLDPFTGLAWNMADWKAGTKTAGPGSSVPG